MALLRERVIVTAPGELEPTLPLLPPVVFEFHVLPPLPFEDHLRGRLEAT
jgi:hypothetical protein